MPKLALVFAFLIACLLCVSRVAISADGQIDSSEVAKEKKEIVKKWNDLRSAMLDTIKSDPLFDATATEGMKLRKTFQVFRVAEYLKAFDVRQEKDLLRLKLREPEILSDSERDKIEVRLWMLKKQAKHISDRIKRLDKDENSGAGIMIHLQERQKQLEDIKKKQWKLPLDLTPRHDSFVI